MRFLYKRPRMEQVNEELDTLMDVMSSDLFILLDLFWLSLIFSLLLTPALQTVTHFILFFTGSYVLFTSVYFFVFKRMFKNC
ncbi:antibiotic biosynthesis monooxygenase (ABM) superfamily enzyme [Neobacillus niacini]|nr:antibiotic biosynthesis monooxygenase (ABM) superfamily enzyme [Neobacillus niacini]